MPAFADMTFKNMAANKTAASWAYVYNGESTPVEGNDDNDLVAHVAKISNNYISSYYIPEMTVGRVSYTFGENFPNNPDVALINGDTVMTITDVNLAAGYYYGFSNGGSFGNRTAVRTIDGVDVNLVSDAIYEFYNKPVKPLYLTDVYFRVVNFEGNPLMNDDTEMKVVIRKVEDGSITDVIAEMPFTMADALYVEQEDGKTFGAFMVSQKEEDAFGTEYDVPVLIADEFVVIISGFEQPDVNFSLYMTGDLKDVETDSFLNNGMVVPTCRSYVRADNGEPVDGLYYCQAITKEQSDQYNIEDGDNTDWTRHYNAVIHLDAMTDVVSLYDGFETMYADPDGGNIFAVFEEENEETGEMENVAYATIQYETTLPRISTWEGLEGEENYEFVDLPDWLTVTGYNDDYYADYDVTLAQLEAAPLPEGMKGRKAEIRIVSERGADSGVITVIQGEVDDTPVKEITDGKYILVNVATGKCWGEGNDWGTRASLVENPEYLKLLKQPDGTFHLETQVNNGGEQIYFNGDYMDNGTPMPLTITRYEEEPIGDGMDDVPVWGYTIANADGQYYGYDGQSTVLGKNINISTEEGLLNALWLVVSEEEMMANLKYATAEDPINVTFLISDPNFGRNNRYYGDWTFEASNKNNAGDNTNFCVESYHSEFTMSQTLENVPNGVYKLTAQGFYRQDGEDNENLPVFFINDATSTFPLKTGAENSMANASVSFKNGLYTCEPIYVKVENGTITLGAKLQGNTNLWCIWDNFVLNYYGPDATIEEVKAAALLEDLYDLQDKAEELLDKVDNDAVKAALQEAINAAAGLDASSGEAAVKAAVDKLADAVDKAEANVIAQNVLPAMKALVDATNVYTEEALNQYYTVPAEKYAAGTLTKAEAGALQNPDVVTGWHEAITVDNFLLSAWDTNPDFVDAPYYINSWSVEGDNDGSNFRVPFFEYWTGDANSLGERTLTATMNNIPEGNYDVTVWARVRAKDGFTAPAYGINLQVNDGAEVNVAAGQQVGTSQFFLDTFKASGVVGADGVLKIKFNVAADNNISWLSFKNVKFEKGAAADDPELVAPEGWTSVIVNGNLAGDNVQNYFSKEYPAPNPGPSTIVAGAGKNGSRGIVVKTQDKVSEAWDSQFFIRFNDKLAEGTQLHVEFDYKADNGGSVSTQSHGEPGAYQHWAAIGNVNFTPEWQHYTADVTVEGAMADMQSIAFNLNDVATADNYYFDNFGIWVKAPEIPDEWADLLVNGNMEGTEVANFFSKEAPSAEVLPSRIFDGMGKDGSRGIKVESAAGASQDWDSQFWIYLPTTLPAGTKYKVEFDYRADRDASADTQAHAAPGNYIFYSMIGSPAFTTEWQHYEKIGSITADQASNADGLQFQSIAFNLSKDRANAVKFFFDNIKFMVEKSWYDTGIRTISNDAAGKNIFNLRGQQVQNPSKGLYIINGKKVVVK